MKRKENRLTVVNDITGKRICEFYGVKIEESIQDDGKTLKLFVKCVEDEA